MVDKLFARSAETLNPSSSIAVHRIHADYSWVLRFQDGFTQEVREYMDTQLVTETFGADGTS